MLSDEQLMQECNQGSHAAFELLVQRWNNRMFAYFYRCTRSMEDAKDLCQELFLKVYQSRKRFQPGGKFTSWIYTVASRLVIDKFARKKKMQTSTLEEGALLIADLNQTPIRDELDSACMQEKVHAAMQQLPTEQRVAIIMRHYEELTFIQIAEILNLSESTVKTRVYRGLKALQKELKRTGFAEADCFQIL